MAEEGVDPAALRRRRPAVGAAVPVVVRPRGASLEFVADEGAPEEIRQRRTNPWSVRELPYDGWEWWYHWWRYDISLTYSHLTNPTSGSVGHRSVWEDYDAGDWDGATLDLYSSVGFWLKPEKTGRLEMWVRTRCVHARYWIWAFDEWGWSGYSDHMISNWTVSLAAGTAGNDEKASWEMKFGGPDDEEKTWSGDIVPTNTTGWLHLVTSQSVPANEWVYVKFGTHDYHGLTADDVSIESRMRNHWHLEEAQYRTLT